jgi:predicted nucleotidyltransferase
MKTAAITAEYNPLHNGHKHQLEYLRNIYGATHIAVVMSGAFVQRGGPAIYDKYTRAKAAVEAGADLVLQLPYVFSGQTAEVFAGGAVGIINRCGFDAVCFGCEDIEAEKYFHAADILNTEPPAYKTFLKEALDTGAPFAAARLKALEALCGYDCTFMRRPNNILALEYIRALLRLESRVEPVFAKRASGSSFRSATVLRAAIFAGEDISAYVPAPYRTEAHSTDDYKEILKARIVLSDPQNIERTAETEAGLGNRFIRYAEKLNEGVETFVEAVSSKRYAKSRIRRILFNMLLDYTSEDLTLSKTYVPDYVRILAANAKGRELLNEMPQDLTRMTNPSKSINNLGANDRRAADIDIKADDLFGIKSQKAGEDIYRKPLIL